MPSRTILLVDDDAFLANLYADKFTKKGYVTHACLSAEDALRQLESGITPDVMLIDIAMPKIDGLMLLQTIRDKAFAPHATVIMLTNEDTPAERRRAEELGAKKYLIKASMIPGEVVDAVTALMSEDKK